MPCSPRDETAGWRRTVWKDDPLQLEAMNALVARVHHVLILRRAAYRPKLAVDETNEVVNRLDLLLYQGELYGVRARRSVSPRCISE